jgi:hypothetical protein
MKSPRKQRLTRIQLKLLKYSDLEICKSPEQDVFNVTQRRLHKERTHGHINRRIDAIAAMRNSNQLNEHLHSIFPHFEYFLSKLLRALILICDLFSCLLLGDEVGQDHE